MIAYKSRKNKKVLNITFEFCHTLGALCVGGRRFRLYPPYFMCVVSFLVVADAMIVERQTLSN